MEAMEYSLMAGEKDLPNVNDGNIPSDYWDETEVLCPFMAALEDDSYLFSGS